MTLTTELKAKLLKRVYYEQPISSTPMKDGLMICLMNRTDLQPHEVEVLNYWCIDNKDHLKLIENNLT